MIYTSRPTQSVLEYIEYFKDVKRPDKINHQNSASKPGYNPQKVAYPSGNAFESLARTNPELFNTKKLKQVQTSKNIVQDFNTYFNNLFLSKAPTMMDQFKGIEHQYSFNGSLYNMLINDYNELAKKIGRDAAKRAVTETYISESLTESGCRMLISIRINANKLLIDSLTKMLKANYTMLGLSSAEAASLIDTLNNEETDNQGVEQVKAILKNPKILSKFKLGENNYDFRPIGGAVIFLSKDPSIQFSQHPSKRLMDIFKYDAIITAHGAHNPIPSIRGKKRRWVIQPVSTLTKSNITHMDDVLRALKKEGFKNVYIGACNPNDDPISDEFKKDLNFKVSMGRSSVLLETEITDSDEYISLLESENTISKLEEIYGNEYDKMSLQELYDEMDNAQNELYLHEGIIDGLINFVKKAVQFIISIWKRIIGFFKNIFSKGIDFIKDKFGGSIESKTKKPVKVSTIEFNGNNAEVKDYVCNSPEDVQNVYRTSNNTIIKHIRASSSEETRHIKAIEAHIESGRVKPDPGKNKGNTGVPTTNTSTNNTHPINTSDNKPENKATPKSESTVSIFDRLTIL